MQFSFRCTYGKLHCASYERRWHLASTSLFVEYLGLFSIKKGEISANTIFHTTMDQVLVWHDQSVLI